MFGSALLAAALSACAHGAALDAALPQPKDLSWALGCWASPGGDTLTLLPDPVDRNALAGAVVASVGAEHGVTTRLTLSTHALVLGFGEGEPADAFWRSTEAPFELSLPMRRIQISARDRAAHAQGTDYAVFESAISEGRVYLTRAGDTLSLFWTAGAVREDYFTGTRIACRGEDRLRLEGGDL